MGDNLNENNDLREQIEDIARKWGAELVGFTPVTELEANAPEGHKPSDILPEAKSLIVVAGGNTLNEDRNYIHETGSLSTLTYIELKDSVKLERRRTRACVQSVHELLIKNGYKSAIESHGWSEILSFKQVSYYAGLGVFGKGTFIIHPKYGTINVLGCIATDAVLEYDKPMDMDLCGDCKECIKACKFGTFKKEGEKYIWNYNKCRFYNTVKKTKETHYGPCNGDCINLCPIANERKQSIQVRNIKPLTETLDEIIQEIKPLLEDTQEYDQMIAKIQEIFNKKCLKPTNYDGFTTESSFVVWITNEELEKNFQCKKIWVELPLNQENLFNRLYDLRDVLNHEWGILIIKKDGTYDFYRPLIWSKVQGIQKLTKQV